MVDWADKIDSARYKSVEEAIFGDAPALQIYRCLGFKNSRELSKDLVRKLRTHTLDEVAQLPEVQARYRQVMSMTKGSLNKVKKSIRLEEDGIAVFEMDAKNININRYAPYYFYPEAKYSISLLRTDGGVKITAMRNPWREFPSANIGEAFERFGGGGHQRVGSVLLQGDKAKEANELLKKVIDTIKGIDAQRLDTSV